MPVSVSAGYRELNFFGIAISNDTKLEKEIETQQETAQLTDGVGQKLRVHRGEFQSQLLWDRTLK